MGILICGLNGAGKSTVGKLLAERLGWMFIDNEDLYFPKTDPMYLFSAERTREEVVRILEEKIRENHHFVFAAVRGDYGGELMASLDCAVLLHVPRETRSRRVRERSFAKFGKRILRGGDLFEKESAWFARVDSRPEDYVTAWLETVDCPVIRADGTQSPERIVEEILKALGEQCIPVCPSDPEKSC